MAMGGIAGGALGDRGEVLEDEAAPTPAGATARAAAPSGNGAAVADALSALGNLGYGPGDAASAVAQAAGSAPEADAATLIRAALKLLAPKG